MEAIIETKTSATSADMTSMSTAEATTVSTTAIPMSTTTTMATPTPRVSTILSTVVSSSTNAVSRLIVKAADKPLRHGNGQWMDPVDQGTLFMMLAVGVTALVGAVYFYLRWRLRKKRHKAIAVQTRKVAVNKTFSRFSQVDEELTVHPDCEDREILQRYSQDCLYNPPPARPPSQPVIPAISGIQPVPVTHSKPYLETDM